MKAVYLLLLLLFTISALAQSNKKKPPKIQKVDIKLDKSNNNIIKVIQAGKIITYNLNIKHDSLNFLKYLRSIPKISQQLEQLTASINQTRKDVEDIKRLLNLKLLEFARHSKTSEGFLNPDALINKLISEKRQLKAQIVQLRTENSQLKTKNSQLETENSQLKTENSQLKPYTRLITTIIPTPQSQQFDNKSFQQWLKLESSIQIREAQLTKAMKDIYEREEMISVHSKSWEKQLTFRVGYGPTNFLTATGEAIPVQLYPEGSIGIRLSEHHLLPPLGFGLAIEGTYLPFNTLTKIASETRLVECFNMVLLTAEPVITWHSLGFRHHSSYQRTHDIGFFVSAGWSFSYPFIVNYINSSTNEPSPLQGKFMNWPLVRTGVECWPRSFNSLPKKMGKQLYIQYEPIDLAFNGQGKAKAHIYQVSIGVSFSLK